MHYSVFFWGVDCRSLSETISGNTQIVPHVLAHIQQAASPASDELALLESLLAEGVSGNWSVQESPDTFTVFCWLLDVFAESIVIGTLRGFCQWDYWMGTQLWTLFLETPPPFAVPTSREEFPAVGFLPSNLMPELLSGKGLAEDVISQDVRGVRAEVLEILESLEEDNLDLLAVAAADLCPFHEAFVGGFGP